MTELSHKVSLKEKIGYGLGDTASNLYFQMLMNFGLFFYTDIFGIAPAIIGTMFLITKIWDTVNDPMMGVIADRTNTKYGKFRPYLLWFCVPMAIIGVATFITPSFSATGKIIYAYVTYTLVMMMYTIINIPYSALLGVISPNSLERTSLSTYRFFLAFVGLFIVLGLTMPMVKFFGGGNQAKGFPITMGVFGLLAIIFFLTTFATTKERVKPPKDQKSNIKQDFKDLTNNKPWLILFVMGLFTLLYIAIRSASIMYYFKYYICNEQLASLFMLLGAVAVLVGVSFTKVLTNIFGKRRLYMLLMGLTSILTIIFYIVPKEQIVLIFILHILINLVMAPNSPLIWAMYADTADYSEWKMGRRATGLIFSAATFSQKFGIAIGQAIAAWLLAWFGFKANIEQTQTAQVGIRLMMSVIPAVGTIMATVAAIFYTLDEPLMEKIEKELEARKNEE